MMGLLLKDFISLKGFWKIISLLFVIFAVVGIGTGSVGLLASTSMVLCAMLPMSALGLDDQCHWSAYACALPVSRRATVRARYLLVLSLLVIAIVAGALISLVSSLFSPVNWRESLFSNLMMVCIVLFMNGLMLPLMYKFGLEKARLLLMLVFMGAMIVFTQVAEAVNLTGVLDGFPLWVAIPASVVLFAGSCAVSERIYMAKDF